MTAVAPFALSSGTLERLPPAVTVPAYDRDALSAGIVHLGVGHFHRAHQAAYLDELIATGAGREWAVCGGSLRASGQRLRDALRGQDHLYTLTIKHADGGAESRVVGALVEHLVAEEDPRRLVERMAAPATRIVSLTITEGGYGPDEGRASAFGLIAEAMRLRRERRLGGVTIMSCDNVEHNGAVARRALLEHAQASDGDLAAWVDDHLSFPSSMVDRVTPRTVEADRAHLLEAYGYRDAWPVTCEPFRQWVLEDDFAAGRPELESVGVQLVPDVRAYEVVKLRLANGTHQAMAYFGRLLGYEFVHDAIIDPDIRALLLRYLDEAIPTLPVIAGLDPHAYGREVIQRFSNPEIADRVERICEHASDRIPAFLLPVVRDRLATGARAPVCATVLASWARYSEAVGEAGERFVVRDEHAAELTALAAAGRSRPAAFLENRRVFGDLGRHPELRADFEAAMERLHAHGARAALRDVARQQT